MSKALGMRCVWGLCGVLGSVLALASVTRAEVSTDVSGSVLVFPKVVFGPFNADSAMDPSLIRDTVIQIANTGNNMVHAECFYVNAQVVNGTPIWQITDFTIWLTRQQPTHWVASEGRAINPSDPPGSDGAGIDPGAIPPVPEGFEGELKCIEVDASGTPFGGNNLKGEELIRSARGDVSKANAIAILANPDLVPGNPPNELTLDNSPNHDGEFNSCPNTWLLDHFVDGEPNPVIQEFNPTWCGADPAHPECPIRTFLTLVPCTEDFENDVPASVTVQFAITNEFENNFSTSTTVTCYLTTRLSDIDSPSGHCSVDGDACLTDQQCINDNDGFCEKNSVFSVGLLGTGSAFTQITPADATQTHPVPDGGVLAIAEEEHFNNKIISAAQVSNHAYAAWNPQFTGNRYDATDPNQGAPPGGPVIDLITIPQGF
jgi:hypothetical protein